MRLFVYGTLRGGECNNIMLGPDRIKICDAWTTGRLAYAFRDGYPVLLQPTWFTGQVFGEVWQANHYAALDVISMELNAGYDAEWVEVYPADHAVEGDPGDHVFEALAFTWKREHGDIIPSGDWKERQ